MDKTLVILPAAGFGTRMGLLPNESKELIPDPYNDNKPLIDWHLDNTKDYNQVVITREEKTDLIDYLAEKQIFTLLINDTTKEWPNSVLYSKIAWESKNILVLPDTRYEPKDIVSKIEAELEDNDFVFCIHEVEDVSKWGEFNVKNNPPFTQEKPKYNRPGYAWGIIGFRNNVGEKLFQAYLDKTSFNLTQYNTYVIVLDKFTDITRTGKIEEYV